MATPVRPVHAEAGGTRAARADQYRPRRARPPSSRRGGRRRRVRAAARRRTGGPCRRGRTAQAAPDRRALDPRRGRAGPRARHRSGPRGVRRGVRDDGRVAGDRADLRLAADHGVRPLAHPGRREPLAGPGGGVAGRRAVLRRSRPSLVRTPSARRPRRRRHPAGGGPCCRSPPRPERVPCSTWSGLAETIAWHHPRLATGGSGRLEPHRRWSTGPGGRPPGSDWSRSARSRRSPTCRCSPDKPMSERLQTLFPEPVDRIVIQADLTAVAPGPLAYAVARDLRLLADQESRGGGGVFRFSAASMRRAFDAGWSAEDVHRWLAEHSVHRRTAAAAVSGRRRPAAARQHPGRPGRGVPAARRRGPGRVAAESPGRRRRSASGRSHRAVLIATVEESELVGLLHELGQTPAVEDASGTIVSAPAAQRVSRAAAAVRPRTRTTGRRDRRRAAGRRTGAPRRRIDRGSVTEDALDQLRLATREALAVRVVYVSADGSPTERELAPLDLEAGSVRAVDRASAQVITIPLARISSVVPAPSGP